MTPTDGRPLAGTPLGRTVAGTPTDIWNDSELATHYDDFRRAYEPGALSVDDFDRFPPTVRTLCAFIATYHALLHQVTDATLVNPDVRP